MAVSSSPTGRILALLRRAAAVSRDEAAVTLGVPKRRIVDLELGRGQSLGYFESRDLAKLYLLCPNCFYRLMDAARDREVALLAGVRQGTADGSTDSPLVTHPR